MSATFSPSSPVSPAVGCFLRMENSKFNMSWWCSGVADTNAIPS